MVAKVYEFMKKEANEKYAEKLTDARWRTATATDVSESTVTRVLKEKRQLPSTSSSFPSTAKKRRVKPRKINIEEFDVGVIRRTIQLFHKEFNQTPSLKNLKNILKDKVGFDGCIASLRTMMARLGYEFRKTGTKRRLMLEKHDLQWKRFKYLKEIKALRDSGRPIVYTDESYIYTNPEQHYYYEQLENKSSAKGPRIMMVHAGSAAGFIPNALLTYENKDDKTDELTCENYLEWLKTQLIPNLPKDAVVVMDDAACHNAISEKTPTLNSSKKEMQAWLTAKNVPFEEDFLRIELYDLIKKNKENFRSYKADDLLKAHNFTVLRLPSNHPDLNPTTNMWDLLRNYVVTNNTAQKSTSILETLNEGFQEVNSQWANSCRYIETIEDEYMRYFQLDFSIIVTDTSESESDEDDVSDVSDDSESDAEMV